MARTYKTLSLSLPPGVVEELGMLGKSTGKVAARVAAEIVLREIARIPQPKKTRRRSWCCDGHVIPIRSPIVIPEKHDMHQTWVRAIVCLCGMCRKQLHGYDEYVDWLEEYTGPGRR